MPNGLSLTVCKRLQFSTMSLALLTFNLVPVTQTRREYLFLTDVKHPCLVHKNRLQH